MLYLKTKYFARWAKKEGISDKILFRTIHELEQGLYEADLGHHLYKKRITLPGRGKRGGGRTILFYQKNEKIVFCLGYSKNRKGHFDKEDQKGLLCLSKNLLKMNSEDVHRLIQSGEFIKIYEME